MEENNSSQIEYDLRDYLIYRAATISVLLIFFLCLGMGFFAFSESNRFKDIFGYDTPTYIMFSVPICGIFLIGIYVLFIDRKKYIQYLKRNHYLIPFDKKEYGYDLNNLPKQNVNNLGKKFRNQNKFVAHTLSVITTVIFIASFIITKSPHPVFTVIMVIVTVCYYKYTSKTHFCGELDKEAQCEKLLPKISVLKFAEALLIMGTILFCFFIADKHLPVNIPLFYNQTMRYYKATEPEKYKLFMDKLPSNAQEVEFCASETGLCYVYFKAPGTAEQYCNDLNEMEDIELIQIDLPEEKYYEFTLKLHNYMSIHKMQPIGGADNFIIYTYFPNNTQENAGYDWYIVLVPDTGEILFGYIKLPL